ncbi:DNA polymerase delta subunit 3-like [Penaeus japonicus]|uniref:DNA polymerase delta subunit 3-like n=1 Tax=Penaeus japonicus TaxID=27405 RepID=UPI001C717AB1|nr:DNA polymerase delta subunit 3-like [Penaeus japonicus]
MVAAPSMDSMYLDNLEEFVVDEGKIITYKWLSLTLGVSSNVAKQMLYHFVTNQRNSDKGDNLNVTYFVSGLEAGEDGLPDMHKVMLVREENLASAKSKLKDVKSIHVYSVQKTKLPDMSVLYTANYDKVKENILTINKYSGIECSAATIRSSSDLEKLQKQNAYQAPPEPPTKIPSKYKPNQTKTSPKKESPGNTNKAPSKGNQIASMFARQTKSNDEKQEGAKEAENKTGKDTTKTTPTSGAKKKGGISSFFSKAPPTTKKTESTKASDTSPTDSESPTIKSEVVSPVKTDSTVSSPIKTESQDSVKEEESEKMDVDSPPKKKAKKLQSKIKTTKVSQKRGKSKSTDSEEPVPKRKRIMQLSDSESSSDEENEGEEESPFPPSPPPEPARIESDSEEDIPPTPQPAAKVDLMKGEKRGKRKKLVDKTFMDEDGFFVTKKEYEYVSDSGEEDPLPVKEIVSPKKQATPPQSGKNASPKKGESKAAASPVKKKQANIMNFFKKK